MTSEIDLAGSAPYGLLQIDERRQIVAVNPEAEAMLGHSERAMLHRPLSEVVFHDSPLFGLIDRVLKLDGDVTAHAVSLSGPGFARRVILDIRLRPVGNGSVLLALLNSSDHEVIDSPASVAAFGRILGHEVKNPLAGISGAAQLLLRQARDDQTALLDIIQGETKRIERLISRLSAFELFSSPRMGAINIHVLLEKVISAESVAQGSQVAISRMFDPSLPEIEADEDHLHEAFQNILRNASEAAISGGTSPSVKIETAFETGFAIAPHLSSGRLGRAIRITIEDNGPGISDESRESMFNLFTSSKSGGRGLGLTVVSEIMTAHRGRIGIDSKPGRSRFSVYLPIIQRRET